MGGRRTVVWNATVCFLRVLTVEVLAAMSLIFLGRVPAVWIVMIQNGKSGGEGDEEATTEATAALVCSSSRTTSSSQERGEEGEREAWCSNHRLLYLRMRTYINDSRGRVREGSLPPLFLFLLLLWHVNPDCLPYVTARHMRDY